MKVRLSLLLIMAILTMPWTIQAQGIQGQLWEVQVMKARPDHMDEFMGTAGMIVEAATKAGIGADGAWHMWIRDFDVAVAAPAENMASFDDPDSWMRQYQGTPGEALLNEAMNKFMNEVSVQWTSREVWEHVAEWSYEPASPSFERPIGAERHDFWIRPGKQEAFDQVAKDIMAFFSEIGGIYPMNGYRIHFGDVSRATFVVFNDNWGDFYGKNSLETALANLGKAAEWQGLLARLGECVTDGETTQLQYLADLSYTGPGM